MYRQTERRSRRKVDKQYEIEIQNLWDEGSIEAKVCKLTLDTLMGRLIESYGVRFHLDSAV